MGAFSDARHDAGLDKPDHYGGGSKGGGGGQGANTPGGNSYAGYRGPIGTRAPNTANRPGSYGLSGPETEAYTKAQQDYLGRGFGYKALDFMGPMGLTSVQPQINQPASYGGGTFHMGINPGGLMGGIAGAFGGPLGMLAGKLGAPAYNATGLHTPVISGPGSGWSTSFPDGGPGYNSSSGLGGAPGQPGQGPQGVPGQQGAQNPGMAMGPGMMGQPQQPGPFGAPPAGAQGAPTPTQGINPLIMQYMQQKQLQTAPGYGVTAPGYGYYAPGQAPINPFAKGPANARFA